MEIRQNITSPSFGLQFYRNNAYRQVLEAANKLQCTQELDSALNNLLHVVGNDILIVHGYDINHKMFSSFVCGKRSVFNETQGCQHPAQASLRAILRLVDNNDPKLMRLLNSKVRRRPITAKYLIDRYTVSNK